MAKNHNAPSIGEKINLHAILVILGGLARARSWNSFRFSSMVRTGELGDSSGPAPFILDYVEPDMSQNGDHEECYCKCLLYTHYYVLTCTQPFPCLSCRRNRHWLLVFVKSLGFYQAPTRFRTGFYRCGMTV